MTTPVGTEVTLQWGDKPGVTPVGTQVDLQWNDAPVDEPMLNEDFILDVDQAMRAKIDGATYVTDADGTSRRRVKAFFRWPQVEVTDQTFPFVVIDRLAFTRAADREQRSGDPCLPYTPKGFTAPPDGRFLHTDDMPIPFDFTYQITAHSRFWLHDTQISEQLLADTLLPPRGAWLQVNDTVRQMFVSGPTDATGMDQQPGGRPKRHFRKVWTATTSGELFQKDIALLMQVTTLVPTITLTDP